MAAVLCRTIMPIPSPSTAASVVNSSAQRSWRRETTCRPHQAPRVAAPPKPAGQTDCSDHRAHQGGRSASWTAR